MTSSNAWLSWALLSAVFAAATAIFAKLGLVGIDSDFATLIRTGAILIVLGAFVAATGKWQDPTQLSPRTWTFLMLSALATGASWVCYFRALQLGNAFQVAPVDKLSVVLVVVLAFFFLGERPSPRDWLGVLLVAGGVVTLAWRK